MRISDWSSDVCSSDLGSEILGETQAGELPALVGVEEIAVGGPHMAARRRAASAAKHELAAHELAIIFAHRAGGGTEARIGTIGAAGPFPHAAEHLLQPRVGRRGGGGLDRAGGVELLSAVRVGCRGGERKSTRLKY